LEFFVDGIRLLDPRVPVRSKSFFDPRVPDRSQELLTIAGDTLKFE
jgi:hypothetical protein